MGLRSNEWQSLQGGLPDGSHISVDRLDCAVRGTDNGLWLSAHKTATRDMLRARDELRSVQILVGARNQLGCKPCMRLQSMHAASTTLLDRA